MTNYSRGNEMKKLIVGMMVVVGLMVGCTSQAGPFVTNISSDGRGGLTIEKCMISLNRQITTVENTGCTNTSITLSK